MKLLIILCGVAVVAVSWQAWLDHVHGDVNCGLQNCDGAIVLLLLPLVAPIYAAQDSESLAGDPS